MEMYSKIRNYCEHHYQRYGDGFRTTDGVGNFSFMVKNEKILVDTEIVFIFTRKLSYFE